ncbi:DUF3108 domain-containing protein [Mesorhizobium sp. SP-1A]|uniref:DUF3108 domain-containing protein n=1 Tax=Mesorhizobium sp. SP-1A TaxID=3077840 RepID=UPI0028F747A8|nr:DUF3108 domain-containing protein [Mesorhizobium sp. SP-1A]
MALVLLLLAAALPDPAAAAGGEAFKGEYTVSFLGLTVARASFSSRYQGDGYSINGSVAAAGLARLFDDTEGSLTASGALSADRLVPRAFRADYKSGKKASLVDIRFSGGGVASTKVVPPPKQRGDDWLPLGPNDLKGVTDPIAATVVRAPDPDKVCGRTVKMYDGEMRANLNLSFVEKGTISVKGYKGPTVTCRLGFEPVSGFAQRRKALRFLRDRSRILVTFAPVGKTGIYAPIRATVGTEIGTITIRARRFEANG